MQITDLQARLQARYDLYIPYSIEQFISCDRAIAEELADAQARTGQERPTVDEEVVFIEQRDDSLEFTVYFDEQLLLAVNASNSDLDGICTIVEGASHAVCLLWHAHNDRQIRPVELELQAEIDKFVMLVESDASGIDGQLLHRCLFANSKFIDDQGSALHDRYRTASKLASRYCHWLNHRFIKDEDHTALHNELARFYRLSGRAKFEHIRQLH